MNKWQFQGCKIVPSCKRIYILLIKGKKRWEGGLRTFYIYVITFLRPGCAVPHQYLAFPPSRHIGKCKDSHFSGNSPFYCSPKVVSFFKKRLTEHCCHVIIHKWVSAMQSLDFHMFSTLLNLIQTFQTKDTFPARTPIIP